MTRNIPKLLSTWHLLVLLGCSLFPATCLQAADPLEESEAAKGQTPEAEVDFNRDIRAILSDKCFLCHGPAENTREAELRLDQRQSAIDLGAIVPGEPDSSVLLQRIASSDADEVMPPPETGKSLSDKDRALLRRWIAQGANYATHWAFAPPQRPELPKVQQTAWPRNAVDYFVLAKMEQVGLQPAAAASFETLARRMTLDLTGLPPTLDQLDALKVELSQVAQAAGSGPGRSVAPQDAVWQGFAEQLLRSPHFGERWARWWLDAARYADSAGYEKDMQREVWFYRDWVINAMNRDMPYDQFVVEQVAGDLLPGASQNQRVATGFLRNSMTNEEGGADPEQFRVEGMFDRMDAIGKSILGITTQCAQCHTHKYDPLTQAEYYRMFAALNDFEEGCISVYTPEQAEQRELVLHGIEQVYQQIRRDVPQWREKVGAWAAKVRSELPDWQTLYPTEVPFEGQKFRVLDDGSIVSESYAPTKASNSFSLTTEVETITAVRLDALPHPQLPRGGPGRSIDGTGALSEFRLQIEPLAADAKPISVKFVRALSDANPKTRDLKSQYREKNAEQDERIVGGIEMAIDGDEKTAWTTDLGPGRSNQARHAIFIPEGPIEVNGTAKLTFTLVQKHGGWNSDDNQNFLLGRYRFSITDAVGLPEQTVATEVESVLRADDRLSQSPTWTEAQWDILLSGWCASQESLQDARQRLEELWQQYPQTTTQLVAIARPQRTTHVLARGDFLSPSDPVEPGVPEFLHGWSEQQSEPDRLRFARWLVSPESPTTARVLVNRLWQAYFGRGLVTTPEDFGFQSAPPSHPQLLDYLACELIEHQWSMKHIHRLILDSATYRQSSQARAEAWELDPANEWLSRGPRVRAEAEMVRDIALAASGLLDSRVGGPSVYPPAPDFLFQPPTSYGPKVWSLSGGGEQYRRSLYVHQYRSVPYPPLQVFDAPKGDAACVRRERSNTPLQALVLLNESQFVDAARGLAARVLREIPSPPANTSENSEPHALVQRRLTHAFRLCTSRYPDSEERRLLGDLLTKQLDHYRSDTVSPEELAELVGVPIEKCLQLTGVPAPELAAWLTVCRAILNLDETITKS